MILVRQAVQLAVNSSNFTLWSLDRRSTQLSIQRWGWGAQKHCLEVQKHAKVSSSGSSGWLVTEEVDMEDGLLWNAPGTSQHQFGSQR